MDGVKAGDMSNYQHQAETIMIDPGASYWLKVALADCLRRDIVDALNDVEVLRDILAEKLKEILGECTRA